MIKHDNIIYVRDIAPIGGVETYVYELVKKYHKNDIAVVCRHVAPEQKKRIEKYCKVYVFKNEPIECKVAIINYDTSIIDYITKDIWKENLKPNDPRGIYQGVHADYTHPSQGDLPQDARIKSYLAITEEILENFPKMTDAKNVMLCRNPLEIEDKKTLIIVSPTRLEKTKGGDLMLEIANELEKEEISFIWFVLTTPEYLENPIFMNKNVVWVKSRLDVGVFLNMADWVVLPSMCEGDSYTIKEALERGVGVVVRELGYFKEYGIKDGKNALFVDDANVKSVVKKMKKPLKFKFKHVEDGYDKIFIKGKSHYKKEPEKMITLRCVNWLGFTAIKENKDLKEGDTITVSEERAEELLSFKGCFEKEKDNKRNVKNLQTIF